MSFSFPVSIFFLFLNFPILHFFPHLPIGQIRVGVREVPLECVLQVLDPLKGELEVALERQHLCIHQLHLLLLLLLLGHQFCVAVAEQRALLWGNAFIKNYIYREGDIIFIPLSRKYLVSERKQKKNPTKK